MWKERQDLEEARKEAKAAGILPDTDENGEPLKEEKKLDQLADTDPYVQVALYLLKGGGPLTFKAASVP